MKHILSYKSAYMYIRWEGEGEEVQLTWISPGLWFLPSSGNPIYKHEFRNKKLNIMKLERYLKTIMLYNFHRILNKQSFYTLFQLLLFCSVFVQFFFLDFNIMWACLQCGTRAFLQHYLWFEIKYKQYSKPGS